MAQALQHDPTAVISELPAAGAANISADTAASGSERSDAVVSIALVQNIRQVRPRATRQISQLQFHCGTPPPAAAPSTTTRIKRSVLL